MTIGENIKRFRLRKHMSQTVLGNEVGVTYRMIQKYEAPEEAPNSVIPSLDMIRKLAAALEVDFYDIVEDEANKEKPVSIKDYFNEVTKIVPRSGILGSSFDRAEQDIFYRIFKGVYEEYQLKLQTEMEALDFFNADSELADYIYEQFVSSIISATILKAINIRIGKSKPVKKEEEYSSAMEEEFDEFITKYRVYLQFGKKENVDMKDMIVK